MKFYKNFCLAAALSLSFASAPLMASYTQTQHPIVLVHGVMGFDDIGGLVNYFHTIPWHLERSGATVKVANVSFVNSSQERGQQLANQLENWGAEKYHLFGHSQGAPTSRYAAHLSPERVASVTSINGVNKGSAVADLLRGQLNPESLPENLLDQIAVSLGQLMNFFTGQSHTQDGIAAMETLTTQGSLALNDETGWKGLNPNGCTGGAHQATVAGHTQHYFSWTGRGTLTNLLDPSDGPLAITGLVFAGEQNDGLVSVCSQKFGQVLANYNHSNHLDAVNHLFGIRSLWHNPVTPYRTHANRLKNLGL
ncbi:triacylglycerol lipase [Marinospirillum celere]|uniref:Triacylglycerol lipase n=1 Tax=Marinospirillum celere TaxID=1122252 RepID=A0A1I1IKF8_9GAMM|nr:triacylglycerol lipase [Marinospirillum celere]SFC33710.1 triacylglycerol lipase [Marinospirillum celere]